MLALWKIPGWKGIAVFTGLILIAGLFHIFSLLCIVFILARFDYKYIFAFIPVAWVGSFIVYTGIGSGLLNSVFSERKISAYVGSGLTRSIVGVASLIIIYLIIVISVFAMNRFNKNHEKLIEYYTNIPNRLRDEYVCKFVLICLAFAFLQYINKNFERYARFMIFMYYVMILNHGTKVSKHHISLNQIACIGILTLYYLYFYISFAGWFEHNLVPIMEKNLLIDLLTE